MQPSSSHWMERKNLLPLCFLIVAVAQVCVMLAIHVLSVSLGQKGFYPIVLGGDDGRFHYAVAKYMLATHEFGAKFDLLDVSIWPTLMAEFMGITGSDDPLLIKQILFVGRLIDISAALIAIEALQKYRAGKDTHRQIVWSRLCALGMVGLFPSGLYYSFGSLYRDALIYGFHLLTCAFLLQAIADKRTNARAIFVALAFGSLYCLYELRQYAAYSVALAALLWTLATSLNGMFRLNQIREKPRKYFVWTLMTLLILTAGGAAWYTRPVQQLIAFRDSYFALEGSNLRISFTGKNPLQALPLYGYSYLSNFIGPLVWQVRTLSNALNFLIEVPLLAYVGVSVWLRRQALTPACTFLIAQAAVWFAMIAFSNDNLGTASRLRVLGWQCLFIVFSYLLPRCPVRLMSKKSSARLVACS